MIRMIIVIVASLGLVACQSESAKPALFDVSPIANTAYETGEIGRLTEEREAAIRKTYGIEKPEQTVPDRSTLVFDTGPQPTHQILVHVKKFLNKKDKEILQSMGYPDPIDERESITRIVFSPDKGNSKMSLHFIDGVARKIEIEITETFKYPEEAVDAIRAVGLHVADGKEPESSSEEFLVFTGIEGFYEVQLVKDEKENLSRIAQMIIISDEKASQGVTDK